ncbi:hypothetical protein [Wolbachia endosymbiont (group A) of Pogonocherus hispidulus]|uniref:hypothetical protein n=1 Tax=Wolbachia endosymbiont (group A) of Pogonocherus hispidulus TaxID=3066136 RepID=UPI00333F8C27
MVSLSIDPANKQRDDDCQGVIPVPSTGMTRRGYLDDKGGRYSSVSYLNDTLLGGDCS